MIFPNFSYCISFVLKDSKINLSTVICNFMGVEELKLIHFMGIKGLNINFFLSAIS